MGTSMNAILLLVSRKNFISTVSLAAGAVLDICGITIDGEIET